MCGGDCIVALPTGLHLDGLNLAKALLNRKEVLVLPSPCHDHCGLTVADHFRDWDTRIDVLTVK